MIYITKCSTFLSFIYRYSQLFIRVSWYHAADVPSLRDFVPNPISCPHLWSQPLLLSPQFFQTCRKMWNKNLIFNVSPPRKVQGCYTRRSWWPSYRSTTPNPSSHRAIEAGSNLTRQSGMPSGGLNENLRTRRNFWNVPDQIVTSSSEVITADFCTTNLGKPSIIELWTKWQYSGGCWLDVVSVNYVNT